MQPRSLSVLSEIKQLLTFSELRTTLSRSLCFLLHIWSERGQRHFEKRSGRYFEHAPFRFLYSLLLIEIYCLEADVEILIEIISVLFIRDPRTKVLPGI
jgi:hypothetical protein